MSVGWEKEALPFIVEHDELLYKRVMPFQQLYFIKEIGLLLVLYRPRFIGVLFVLGWAVAHNFCPKPLYGERGLT